MQADCFTCDTEICLTMPEDKQNNREISNVKRELSDLRRETHSLKAVVDDVKRDLKDINPRLIRVEERGKHAIWTLGIALPFLGAFIIGGFFELYSLNGSVSALAAQLAGITPKTVSTLLSSPATTKEDVAKNAQLAAAVISAARKNSLPSNKAELEKSGQQLISLLQRYPDVDSLWNAGTELINYRSFLSSPHQYANIHLPNCDPHPSRDLTITTPRADGSVETSTLRNAISIVQENCFLNLDEYNFIEDYACHKCVIQYSGGSVTLKGPVEFKDCLFTFSINSRPASPSGQLLAESLLTQNPQDIKIPSG